GGGGQGWGPGAADRDAGARAAAGGALPRNRDPHPGGGDQPSGDRTDAGHEPAAERLSADRARPGALLQHQPPRRPARPYRELSVVPWPRSAAWGPLPEQHGDRHRDGRRRPCGGDRRAGRAQSRGGHHLGSGGGGGGVPYRVDGAVPSATAVSERAAPFKAAVPDPARRILTSGPRKAFPRGLGVAVSSTGSW